VSYLITARKGCDGVHLAKLGHYGNIPFPSDADAVRAAKREGGDNIVIEREMLRR